MENHKNLEVGDLVKPVTLHLNTTNVKEGKSYEVYNVRKYYFYIKNDLGEIKEISLRFLKNGRWVKLSENKLHNLSISDLIALKYDLLKRADYLKTIQENLELDKYSEKEAKLNEKISLVLDALEFLEEKLF